MQIYINDTPTECKDRCTLDELLAIQGISPVNIAVAMDDCVIPKTQWSVAYVNEGSRILIIKAVQGG